MTRPKLHRVELSESDAQRLHELINKGHASARVIRRAHVLLLAAKDQQDKDVAGALHLNAQTVYQLRKRFASEGLEATLYDKPRLGSKPMLDGKKEALLVALACSQPDDRESWTIKNVANSRNSVRDEYPQYRSWGSPVTTGNLRNVYNRKREFTRALCPGSSCWQQERDRYERARLTAVRQGVRLQASSAGSDTA